MTDFGKYRLLRKLGTGGMAEAYLAEQPGHAGFARTVVVKRVLPHLADKPEFAAMLVHEARVAAWLQHDNIAQIYDLGHEGDTYYIAMEYVQGLDLAAVVDRADERRQSPIPLGSAARVIIDVCAGLHHAHTARDEKRQPLGLVHRDVSPENIMVTPEGTTKLIDFGVAKATLASHDSIIMGAKGKHAYMSPEQARSRPLDARSDQFAVGIIAWELATGQRLFRREADFLSMRAVVEDPVFPVSRVRSDAPERLDHILGKALEKDPEDRFASCEELAEELEDLARRSRWDTTTRTLGKLVARLM
jgi:eukaryotic-like serine/threonine-protein kinase